MIPAGPARSEGVEVVGLDTQGTPFNWNLGWPRVGKRLLARDSMVYGLKELLPDDVRWRARKVTMQQVDHHWSESRPGKWPCVEAWMWRYRVELWRRPYVAFYVVATHVQLRQISADAKRPFSLDAESAFASWGEARNHWAIVTRDLRPQIR